MLLKRLPFVYPCYKIYELAQIKLQEAKTIIKTFESFVSLLEIPLNGKEVCANDPIWSLFIFTIVPIHSFLFKFKALITFNHRHLWIILKCVYGLFWVPLTWTLTRLAEVEPNYYLLMLNTFLTMCVQMWTQSIFRAFFLQDDTFYGSHLVLDLVTPMPSTT